MRRIVYTRPDGGVVVCTPTRWCISMLANGGFFPGGGVAVEQQVERGLAAGRKEWAVRRYVRAMQDGGCTTAEAYEIVRDRDCGHLGSGFELWAAGDLPDRWFRDAWQRSHNGGPIMIDLKAARAIQFRRIKMAAERENKRRAAEIDLFDHLIELPLGAIRDRIHKAQGVDELRRIWPQELTP
jgi:hypothetical protein